MNCPPTPLGRGDLAGGRRRSWVGLSAGDSQGCPSCPLRRAGLCLPVPGAEGVGHTALSSSGAASSAGEGLAVSLLPPPPESPLSHRRLVPCGPVSGQPCRPSRPQPPVPRCPASGRPVCGHQLEAGVRLPPRAGLSTAKAGRGLRGSDWRVGLGGQPPTAVQDRRGKPRSQCCPEPCPHTRLPPPSLSALSRHGAPVRSSATRAKGLP